MSALERWLCVWKHGDINSLVRKGRALHSTLAESQCRGVNSQSTESNGGHVARVFSRLMLQGKVKAALWWLSQGTVFGITCFLWTRKLGLAELSLMSS